MWSLTFLVVLSVSLGVGAWLFFLWSARSGQYDDVEGPKYRMLDDEENGVGGDASPGGKVQAPRPKGREASKGGGKATGS